MYRVDVPCTLCNAGFLINLLRLKYFKEGSKLWCLQIPQVDLFFEGHDDSKQFLTSCVTQILDGTSPEMGTFDRFFRHFCPIHN